MKKISYWRLFANRFDSVLRPRRRRFGDQEVLSGERAGEFWAGYNGATSFAVAHLSPYAARLLYEFTKHRSPESDYSKKLYLPADYRVNSTLGTISKFSLDHVATELLKSIEKVDALLIDALRAEERFAIKYLASNKPYLIKEEETLDESNLLESLDGRRVLVISPQAELIKIQHLHQEVFHRDRPGVKGDFGLLALAPDEIFRASEAYSLFDKEDALKVEILKYDFDVALLDVGLLGLPLTAFIGDLGKRVFDLEELLYQIFGIARDSAEKSRHDNFWVDLSSYRSGVEKTFLATGVIGAPIKIKKKGNKRVH